MKKIILMLVVAISFMGCGSSVDQKNLDAKLVVGKSLKDFELKDQHEKVQRLPKDTKVIFFSFSKPVGHKCNQFLEKHPGDYLPKHNTVYVADVSPAPSIIKNMFILPDLKKLKFPILLINDDKTSAEYNKGINKDKIVIVYLKDRVITKISYIDNQQELEDIISK